MTGRRFSFRGEIPSSKSILIRSLLMQAYRPGFQIEGAAACDDVRVMKQAMAALLVPGAGPVQEIHCGEAGLVLRLMLACVSRFPGEYLLTGSPRLLDRPHAPLFDALLKLGVRAGLEGRGIRVSTSGWRIPAEPVSIDRSLSSQFASAWVLNSWGLPSDLELRWQGEGVSSGYLEISLQLARDLGMRIEETSAGIRIARGQKVNRLSYRAEIDLSSAFAVAALAAVAGDAEILNFSEACRQPDVAFLEILPRMGVPMKREGSVLRVGKASRLLPIRENLGGCPDLFPVLGALCALAEGRSELRGAPHLRHKESDRIEQVARLIEKMGRVVERFEDGLAIEGRQASVEVPRPFDLDPERDHRMVMAGAVACWAGIPIHVLSPEVVSKSFPEFLPIAGLTEGAAR